MTDGMTDDHPSDSHNCHRHKIFKNSIDKSTQWVYSVNIKSTHERRHPMKKERMFLVTTVIKGKLVIVGHVTSSMYPSTIVNDHEKSKEMFGYAYVDVIEVPERCHIELTERRF